MVTCEGIQVKERWGGEQEEERRKKQRGGAEVEGK